MWTPALLRADIPVLRHTVYLNTGTLGPSPQTVTVAFVRSYQRWQMEGPGRPDVYEARRAAVEGLRGALGLFLNVPAAELALADNVTTAINWVASAFPFRPGDEVIVGQDEHPANRLPWRALEAMGRVQVKVLPMLEDDEALLSALDRLLGPRTRLVALSHVLQTTGRILPIARLVELARARGVHTVVDGAQAVGQLPVDVAALGADAYAFNGHKWLLGPVGTGGLHLRPEFSERLGLLPAGAGSTSSALAGRTAAAASFLAEPRRWEVGTRNWPLYEGWQVALAILQEIGVGSLLERARALAEAFLANLPSGVTAVPAPVRGGMVSVTVGGHDAEVLVQALYRRHRVVVRSVPEYPPATLRFCFAGFHEAEDVARALTALHDVCAHP